MNYQTRNGCRLNLPKWMQAQPAEMGGALCSIWTKRGLRRNRIVICMEPILDDRMQARTDHDNQQDTCYNNRQDHSNIRSNIHLF